MNCKTQFVIIEFYIGACYISRGLIKGAEKAGDLINNKTPELINKITPAQQAARINPKLSKGLKIAGTATNGAVQVTGFVGMWYACKVIKYWF